MRFDVSTSQDTEETFTHRVANTASDSENVLSNDTSRWWIGINRRNQGSIHSDFIRETAAQIAAYDKIAIYPATGWQITSSQYHTNSCSPWQHRRCGRFR